MKERKAKSRPITVDYALKVLARAKQKNRFMHKTKYGRALGEAFGYDKKAHEEHYQRIKNTPYSPRVWE